MIVPRGSLLLFLGVFADQLGLPLPGLPLLLGAGALAGAGTLHPAGALALAIAAAVLADLLWYELGRRHRGRALGVLCRVALEPDSCVRRTGETFARHGVRLLLFARFVPAVGLLAAPLAGVSRVGRPRFLLYDGLGAVLWAGGYMALGYAFSDQLERAAASASRAATWLAALLVVSASAYVAYRYVRRQLVLRRLPGRPLGADELSLEPGAGDAHPRRPALQHGPFRPEAPAATAPPPARTLLLSGGIEEVAPWPHAGYACGHRQPALPDGTHHVACTIVPGGRPCQAPALGHGNADGGLHDADDATPGAARARRARRRARLARAGHLRRPARLCSAGADPRSAATPTPGGAARARTP